MPKIFALRSRLLEVQNSLLCNPGAVGKGDEESRAAAHDNEAHKAHVGRRGPWDVGRGTAWDEDWGASSLLVGDPTAATAAAVEVPEPKVVAEEQEEEEEKDEDDTGKIDSLSGLRNTFTCCMLCGKM